MEMVIAYYQCCTLWPCAFGYPMGRCGLCNERPVFVRFEDDELNKREGIQ